MEHIDIEMGQLLLNNWETVEKSYQLAYQMDDDFWDKIYEEFSDWYEKIQEKTAVWSRNCNKENDSPAIWFELENKSTKNYDTEAGYLVISVLSGLARYDDGKVAQYGICFGFNRNFFALDAKNSKRFMEEQFKKYPELEKAGFQYVADGKENRIIFLPVELELAKLVAEYPDYDEAFQPLYDACQAVEQHLEIFKKIAAELMEKYWKE
ncbi:hypothetical protein [Kingella oralis]|jgi:hypothetical protein|uniref:hypothetical protein n=1 Tax=Kingella oralis TaxID=505 RepID=UPI0034E381BC